MTYRTFKFFDHKKRRLAIFGKQEGNLIKITIIPCNKKDRFNKATAFKLYEACWTKKDTITISFQEKPFQTFINFCNENFYKLITVKTIYKREVLINTYFNDKINYSKLIPSSSKLSENV